MMDAEELKRIRERAVESSFPFEEMTETDVGNLFDITKMDVPALCDALEAAWDTINAYNMITEGTGGVLPTAESQGASDVN